MNILDLGFNLVLFGAICLSFAYFVSQEHIFHKQTKRF